MANKDILNFIRRNLVARPSLFILTIGRQCLYQLWWQAGPHLSRYLRLGSLDGGLKLRLGREGTVPHAQHLADRNVRSTRLGSIVRLTDLIERILGPKGVVDRP